MQLDFEKHKENERLTELKFVRRIVVAVVAVELNYVVSYSNIQGRVENFAAIVTGNQI